MTSLAITRGESLCHVYLQTGRTLYLWAGAIFECKLIYIQLFKRSDFWIRTECLFLQVSGQFTVPFIYLKCNHVWCHFVNFTMWCIFYTFTFRYKTPDMSAVWCVYYNTEHLKPQLNPSHTTTIFSPWLIINMKLPVHTMYVRLECYIDRGLLKRVACINDEHSTGVNIAVRLASPVNGSNWPHWQSVHIYMYAWIWPAIANDGQTGIYLNITRSICTCAMYACPQFGGKLLAFISIHTNNDFLYNSLNARCELPFPSLTILYAINVP